jgi:hypothetical protein
MRTIVVASYRFRHEGEQARGYLADAGIGSLLHTDDGVRPRADNDYERTSRLDAVQLFVRADDAARARALLDDAGDLVFG